MLGDEAPLWKREPLRDKKGKPVECGHPGCFRYGVRVVGWEAPKHTYFRGQTHYCCSVHSRPSKEA